MFYKILLIVIFSFSTLFGFFGGGCPPCICYEHTSHISEKHLISKDAMNLKRIVNNQINKTSSLLDELIKQEQIKLTKLKIIVAYEKVQAIKLKEFNQELDKKIKKVELEIKTEILNNKNLTILQKKELLNSLK